jgi:hypothetical protein
MGYDEFQDLAFHEKIKKLYFDGEFIVSIRYYGYKVNLYLLNRYYIEVFYNHKEDRVEKINLLDRRNKRMKFYTDQIRLSQLA